MASIGWQEKKAKRNEIRSLVPVIKEHWKKTQTDKNMKLFSTLFDFAIESNCSL